jgi:hypothetical protein
MKIWCAIASVVGGTVTGIAVLVMTAWAVLAIHYSNLPGPGWRTGAAVAFGGGVLALFGLVRPWRRAVSLFFLVFAAVVLWWLTIPAANQRDWQPDVAVLPSAMIDGDRVTVRNIRDLVYRTETDFTPRYYDKTFDLNKLDGLDLIAVYWMGDAIAHIMLSFEFGGEYLTVSIETRKERDERYSSLLGFFKQYELIYIVGDERDLVGVRTTYRNPPEDVYLYRTRMDPPRTRALFLEYLREINDLTREPAWYNTLTTNCTTDIVRRARLAGTALPRSWKILLSGYVPEYLYDLGGLDTSLPFAELRARSRVNDRARAASQDPAFSLRIREGLPGMHPQPGRGA